MHFVDVTISHPRPEDGANGTQPLRTAKLALASKQAKYERFFGDANGSGPPALGHLSVAHLPYESYGGSEGLVARWYERMSELCYPGGEPDEDGVRPDPGGARARMQHELRVRVGVALQKGNARILNHWRARGGTMGPRDVAAGWWLV